MVFAGLNQKLGAMPLAWLVLFSMAQPAMGQGASPGQGATAQTMAGLDEIRPYLTPPAGVVISARDGAVFIGKESGAPVPSGITVKIIREKEPLIHPVTGEKIGAVTEPVGEVLVTGDDGKIITAARTEPGPEIRPGDRIESVSGKKKAVFIFDAKTESPAMASLRSAAIERLSSFGEVSLVSPFATERFIHDQRLAGAGVGRLTPENLKEMRASLSADFLIFAGVEEKEGAVLVDVTLYDLASGVKTASFKGLAKTGTAKKPVAALAETPAPSPAVKPVEPVKIPLVTAETPALKEPAKEEKPAKNASPVTMKQLGSFDTRITGLAVHDVDGDGAPEIIIGSDTGLAIHKISGDTLSKPIWEKSLSSRDQVVGVYAGDFDKDGKPEIYVNNIVDGSARSKIFKAEGAGFTEAQSKLNIFFYTSGGELYGQKQSPDLSMEDRLLLLEWSGGKLSEKPFMPLPAGARISGIVIDDMDGDGVVDVAGFDKTKSLIYHSSVKGGWVRIDGEFGGSDIAMELPGQGEARLFHEAQPSPVILKARGKFSRVFTPHNHPATSFFTSLMLYLKSQLHLLSNEGMGYSQTFATPVTDGLIYATAYYGVADGATVALASKTESSIFGPVKTELFMFTIGNE